MKKAEDRQHKLAEYIGYDKYICHRYGNDKRQTDKQWLLYLATAYQAVQVDY